MTTTWVIEVVGAAALVVTSVAVLPQILRILRVGSTAGVSPLWAMLGVVSTGAWTVYTGARGLWWATVADALSCAAYIATVIVLARNGVRPRLVAGALWLGAFVLSFLMGGLSGVGAVLAIAFVIQVAPSIWTAYQTHDLLGASLGTWLLTCAEGALWLIYGLAKGDLAVVAFGLCAVVAALLLIVRIRWWSRRRPVPAMAVETA